MDKRLIFLCIASIVIFITIIFSINVLIKRYATETTLSQIPSQTREHSVTNVPMEENKTIKPEEEPEREMPIQDKESLLN